MADIQVITLDLDNTLWDVDRTILRAEAQMKAWLREHASAVYDAYQPELLQQLREGILRDPQARRHDLTYMRTRVLTEIGRHVGYSSRQAETVAQQAFAVFFVGRNEVEFFPGALDMLREVSAHYPICALTNGNADIERAGIGEFFQGAYCSADIGTSKPDPEMFTRPLTELGFEPHHAVHVGDHLVDDIQGANDAGLASVWVNLRAEALHADGPQPHQEVTELTAVPAAIRSINQG